MDEQNELRLASAALVLLLLMAGCEEGAPTEEAACENLTSLTCTPGIDQAACVASFIDTRDRFDGTGACRAEYEAFLRCGERATCPDSSASGSLCADESLSLSLCGGGP